ncbi:MAG: RNA-binding transcriptional accessory protein, partial [Clostridia bacterium]|nr:RNA-binding transcriptional accessory protein [Clostridia bacterium]
MDIVAILTREFSLQAWQVQAVIDLLDAGNTIPFIARYRKEATGSLDDQLLRELSERLEYLRNMDKRRDEIAKTLDEQGVLTDELRGQLAAAQTLSELEDIYRPFRPKRRTRATMARERGLEPLALRLLMQSPGVDPLAEAAQYVDEAKDVPDAEAALAGARDIVAEMVGDDAALRKKLRDLLMREGVVETKADRDEDSVYSMYYDYREAAARMASHRVLAVNRGEREGFLKVSLIAPQEAAAALVKGAFVRGASASSQQVAAACEDAWERLLFPSLEREIRNELTDRANAAAIQVFSENLHQLLMQPPVKGKVTLGVDPGFRTGCKLAVVDENGKVLDTGVGHFTL